MRNPLSISKPEASGYAPVPGRDETTEAESDRDPVPTLIKQHPLPTLRDYLTFLAGFLSSLVLCAIALLVVLVAANSGVSSIFRSVRPPHHGHNPPSPPSGKGDGDDCGCGPKPKVPQYFQTYPELWAGPTRTGKAPFLAQTRTWDVDATATGTGAPTGYVPNEPLQTAIPVEGMREGDVGIFGMMGYLAPYRPSDGFGVGEWPLPEGAEIVQVQMLSRHGARYPTQGANVVEFGEKVGRSGKAFKAKGELEFLNEWEYQLGEEILVPKGRQELFDSGVLHSYMYSQLYNPNSKIIVRTTTQDRMLKSAEYFVAGFFGLQWTRNATIEVIIEEDKFNNSLAGHLNCPNSHKVRSGTGAAIIWINNYLQNATARLGGLIDGFEWTIEDSYAAQTMCAYETVAYGFSRFCELFTYEEWAGFGYSVDLAFYGDHSFGSPTGRAVGIGYQQEVVARLRNHTLGYSGSQINVTLDNNTVTFPLNQSIYLDFSHDTNIISVLTAFGLRQFAGFLDPSRFPGPHNFTVSRMTPFGARLDIEIIRTPRPILADRSGYLRDGDETKYIHFVLNQRTIPLGWSLPECDASRVDGWCELGAFLAAQDRMVGRAQFEKACFGDYEMQPYGFVVDGSPV
ncbi:3-phytase [Madurella fahalii]|uniref:3-phytase n=1 Tax=Madurella fahalii TaxID=1157608 RepID=A0ABQ0FX58_9PEZI